MDKNPCVVFRLKKMERKTMHVLSSDLGKWKRNIHVLSSDLNKWKEKTHP